jgi:tRNA (mo5U34)-methyltransferase
VPSTAQQEGSLADRIEGARWYHTLELPGGIVTRGRYDLRPIVDRLPWPPLEGRRCLDLGSRDGFYAFEMERRGASRVVSVDISDPNAIQFPVRRPQNSWIQGELDDGNRAFDLAREALESSVERRHVSIYDLEDADIGSFDFAFIGTLLLHLRDPAGALSAVRGVLAGELLVNDPVAPGVDLLRRRPMAELVMLPGKPFWWGVNPAGLRRLIEAGGFEVIRAGRPYLIPNGPGARRASLAECFSRPVADVGRQLLARRGALHCWVLARPASNGGVAGAGG